MTNICCMIFLYGLKLKSELCSVALRLPQQTEKSIMCVFYSMFQSSRINILIIILSFMSPQSVWCHLLAAEEQDPPAAGHRPGFRERSPHPHTQTHPQVPAHLCETSQIIIPKHFTFICIKYWFKCKIFPPLSSSPGLHDSQTAVPSEADQRGGDRNLQRDRDGQRVGVCLRRSDHLCGEESFCSACRQRAR